MSAAEIPELDPKNMMVDIPGPYGNRVTGGMFFDPIAKLTANRGGHETIRANDFPGYDAGGQRFVMHYKPGITREMLESGEYWQLGQEKKIKSIQISLLTAKYKFADDALLAVVEAAYCYGLGFRMHETEFGGIKLRPPPNEGDPGFEFWPVGVPGRSKALAIYFLHGLQHLIMRGGGFQNMVKRGACKRLDIAIDRKLFALVGSTSFPKNEAIGDDHILILSKEAADA